MEDPVSVGDLAVEGAEQRWGELAGMLKIITIKIESIEFSTWSFVL